MIRKLTGTALATILMVALVATSVTAAPSSAVVEEHCVVTLTEEQAGPPGTAEMKCFKTFDASIRSMGYDSPDLITPDNVSSVINDKDGGVALAVIAIHYDKQGYDGPPSLAVQGSSCTGGYINFVTDYTSWNNKIESTQNFCGGPAIRLYDFGFSGGLCNPNNNTVRSFTVSESSHGTMNNKASCAKYGGSA